LFCSVSQAAENTWLEFVHEPNEANYNRCRDLVNGSLTGFYEQYQSPAFTSLMADDALGKLLTLSEDGNIYAAHLCFQIYPLFYPGYPNILEHLDISLGKFIKKEPESFLVLLKTYVINGKCDGLDFDGILLNYGDEFVDNFEKSLQETKERIRALESVERKDLIYIKNKCLQILIQRRDLFRRVLQKMLES
jgi:hypothetical protein